jgi:hypothetical protein
MQAKNMRLKQILKLSVAVGIIGVAISSSAQVWKVQTDATNGLRTITYLSHCGDLSILLPSMIQIGDQISGAYLCEPKGTTDKERAESRQVLNGFILNISGVRLNPLDHNFRFMALYREIPFSITDPHENCGDQVSLPLVSKGSFLPEKAITIPSNAKVGCPFVIRGDFDGDASNTKCTIDDKPLEILTESPRQIVVRAPMASIGGHYVQITERGKSTKSSVLFQPNSTGSVFIQ